MDTNKLAALKALPYVINPVCGLCKHGKFPNDDWGSCEATKYDHLKHSDATRDISIHKYGSCPNFEEEPKRVGMLARFQEFFESPDKLKLGSEPENNLIKSIIGSILSSPN